MKLTPSIPGPLLKCGILSAALPVKSYSFTCGTHPARGRQYMSQIHTPLDLPVRAADRIERSPGRVERGEG